MQSVYLQRIMKKNVAKGYEKTNPKQSQFKHCPEHSRAEWANSRKDQMNVNSLITKDYRKKDDFVVRINKPNFRNGQNERKLNLNKGIQKKRCFRSPKTNPIKPNQSLS